MQTLFKKKKITIDVNAPTIVTPALETKKKKAFKIKPVKLKVERKGLISILWIFIKFLFLIAICAGAYYKFNNLYTLSLVFFFTFLVLFFVPQETFLVTSLLTVICAALYMLGYELYYIKVGEFIFVSIGAGVLRLSGVLFEKEKKIEILKQ